MLSSKRNALNTTLPFFILSIVFHAATASDPLYHFCFNPENFTANSPFAANLNQVLGHLSANVPPTGFGVSTAGGGEGEANGLGLCRGDVTAPNCKACVVEAAKELGNRCPYNKGAVIWYDNCLVKYSDEGFFGKIDTANRFYMWNVQDVVNPETFNPKVKELLGGLAYKASASAQTPKLYATGELELGAAGSGADQKLYGLAQCTRDLGAADCKKCLDDAISELPNCCTGKRGGRVVGASCYVRFELYPIVDA